MKNYAFIFARGGSKGIPHKNIKILAGKPLIAYAIEISKKIEEIDRVFVSTDHKQICDVSKKWGAEVILRPKELAQDNSPEWLAWAHAVSWVEEKYGGFERFISLPPTSPLRNKSDVLKCLNALDSRFDVAIGITEATHSPWFNMVRKGEDEKIMLVNSGQKFYNRQETPLIYNITTCAYVMRPEFIKSNTRIFDGKVTGVEIPNTRAIDIDTPMDFQIAEFLMSNNKEVCDA